MRVAFFRHVPHYTEGLSASLIQAGVDVTVIPEPEPLVSPVGQFSSLLAGTALAPARLRDLLAKARLLSRFDVVHTQGAVSSAAAVIARHLYGVPFVLTSHGFPNPFGYSATASILYETSEFASIRFVCRRASEVATVSYHSRAALLSMHGIDARVIYYGVDGRRFHPGIDGRPVRSRLGMGADEKLVLWANRMIPLKDPLTLVRAARRVSAKRPDVRFLMAGEGDFGDSVQREARDLIASGRLVLAGRIPFEEIAGYYSAADLVVFTSSAREGLPLGPIEAMACDRPVAVCRAGPFPEIVEKNGFYFSPGDYEALAEVMLEALGNASSTGDIARKGGESVRRRFTWAEAAERYKELYARAMSEVN